MTQAANLGALGTNAGTTGILASTGGGTGTTAGVTGFKNRIINGAMVIDQRNAGASVTGSTSQPYTLDRWQAVSTQNSKYTVQQDAGAITPPVGFNDYLGVTSSSAYSVTSGDVFLIRQSIEGFNIADLGWGTANAKTVTISFWVRSSLTGTFGGRLGNSAPTRSYPFSYTISTANTWEQKTVTIAGDTSGTWLVTNGIGMQVCFSLGAGSTYSGTANTWAGADYTQPTGSVSVVGTNGATFYITGVQLEVGSTATSFDTRSYGTELALAQRYFVRKTCVVTPSGTPASLYQGIHLPVAMRTNATISDLSFESGTGATFTSPTFGANTSGGYTFVYQTNNHSATALGSFYASAEL